jgi:hypothetical protein
VLAISLVAEHSTTKGDASMKFKHLAITCLSVVELAALPLAAHAQQDPGGNLRHFQKFAGTAGLRLPPAQSSGAASVGGAVPTVVPLANQPPIGINYTMLLTDGSVMAQDANSPNMWWKLSPDINGSYLNGTWTQLASLAVSYSPDASASAVLADGRVIVIGGEYSGPHGAFTLTNKGSIYDPYTNKWTRLDPPPGIDYIGDSPSMVLPDGRFLLGPKLTTEVVALDPATLTWTSLGSSGKNGFNAEEGWTLLPNGTVLTADVLTAPAAEAYSPSGQAWIPTPTVPVDLHSPTPVHGCIPYGPPGGGLCYYPPGEIGPAILRPDGTVFATGSYANDNPNFTAGSAGHTAIYDTHAGTWTQGPDFPNNDNAGDSFAVLLPNGHVLVEGYLAGYEFDGANFYQTVPGSTYLGGLSVLPSGEVLFGGFAPAGFPAQLYSSPGSPDPNWAPVIWGVQETKLHAGSTYQVWGKQFNGLSQAQSYGDEFQASQNYPLVRITNEQTHHVFYARTHDHSTMAVATGNERVWTWFDVPAQTESGPSQLEVVANGIASQPVSVHIQAAN